MGLDSIYIQKGSGGGGGGAANGGLVVGLANITYSDLLTGINAGTQPVGFYNVTDRPNSGTTNLTVQVMT